MSNVAVKVETLGDLVQRLVREHRDFASQTKELNQIIESELPASQETRRVFATIEEALVEHMLVEETEIFPEVSNRGLFSERVSEIMQQHLDITAALDRMKFGLHGRDIVELRAGFNELLTVMNLHFPAEENEVFSLVV